MRNIKGRQVLGNCTLKFKLGREQRWPAALPRDDRPVLVEPALRASPIKIFNLTVWYIAAWQPALREKP